ncbi:lipid A ABC transporter permease/ATP-binding protein [Desulfomarina profundi]|uniref:Lipid A ABC transporter permease/ATP-binding protein n=1 Tax=Desulfomarina profundi TaxID=2772557 RepID=A0A8D5FTE3_9BACT|nr:ABC transporter ATP-binding protein [Desulfomarina profundi]BCL59537.1 lipid A ABC transporter permease/ATP-binding protein [Desulfomarina profundi]
MKNFGYSEEGARISLGDFQLWRRIAMFCRPHLPRLFLALVLSLLVTGATLALPHLMQNGIDNFITNHNLTDHLRIAGLMRTAIFYGGIVGALFVASFCQIMVLEWIGQSIMHTIRQELFSHLLSLDMAFFNSTPTGRLVTRLTNDIQNMHEMFTSVIITLFNDLLRLGAIIVLLYLMNPNLAALMTIFVPLSLIITVSFARLARERFRAIRTQLARLNSFLSETISGIAILQLFGREESSRQEFEELSEGFLHHALRQIKLFGTFMPLTEFMSSTAVAMILWYGGGEVLENRLTLGELVAFLSYMRLFFQPLRELSQKYSIVQSAMASAERIFQLLDRKSNLKQPAQPKKITNPKGRLQFKNITFSYNKIEKTPLIEEMSLTIEAGETVALVGTTGSGKTTLVSLLLRFYDPEKGNITIDGVNISELDLHELRTLIGVILQEVLILQDTLLANIVLDTGRTRTDVENIMRKTGMTRFVEKLPEGLDTLIGEGGQELSTGEKQLLAFARVLCKDPAILILDEATAAIDTESENILEEAIADSFTGRTSLIIAHRLSTIRRADRIIVMQAGKIIEQGTHMTLLNKKGEYARMVAMDRKG